ncbi:hypothetical protein AHAS_Ahas09G0174100 [Arachis hypogaea]|nr:uncharacterized protein LOC112709318 [Arachis hypogaea]
MMLRKFFNDIRSLEMTELPNYIKPKLSLDYIKNSINRGLDNYYTKYIKINFTNSVYHICLGGHGFVLP